MKIIKCHKNIKVKDKHWNSLSLDNKTSYLDDPCHPRVILNHVKYIKYWKGEQREGFLAFFK